MAQLQNLEPRAPQSSTGPSEHHHLVYHLPLRHTTDTHTQTYMQTHIHTKTHIHTDTYTHTERDINTDTDTYTHIYTYIYTALDWRAQEEG